MVSQITSASECRQDRARASGPPGTGTVRKRAAKGRESEARSVYLWGGGGQERVIIGPFTLLRGGVVADASAALAETGAQGLADEAGDALEEEPARIQHGQVHAQVAEPLLARACCRVGTRSRAAESVVEALEEGQVEERGKGVDALAERELGDRMAFHRLVGPVVLPAGECARGRREERVEQEELARVGDGAQHAAPVAVPADERTP